MTEDGMSNTEIGPLHPNSYETQEIWQTIQHANLKIQSPFSIIIKQTQQILQKILPCVYMQNWKFLQTLFNNLLVV
jgi:hypothetical protein